MENNLIGNTKRKESFNCDVCPKQFADGSFLNKHKATKHQGIEVSEAFSQEITVEEVEVEPSTYECDMCENVFDSVSLLSKHKISHKVGEFNCNTCGKHFVNKKKLRKHEKIHSGQGEHVCEVCQKRFQTNSSLKLHSNIHLPVLPFKCDVCQKEFAQKGNLKAHVKSVHRDMYDICITNNDVQIENESSIVEDSEPTEVDDERILG